jgi:hypothetical protein
MSVLVIGLQSDRQRAAGKCCSRAGSAASRVSLQTLCMALNLGCRLCPLCGEQAQQSASPAVSRQQTADSRQQTAVVRSSSSQVARIQQLAPAPTTAWPGAVYITYCVLRSAPGFCC